MPETATRAKRVWRWVLRGLGVLVILVAVVIAVFYLLATSAASRWERLSSRVRADGEPLTFAEIEALRPAIEDEGNGAQAIRRAAEKLRTIEEPDDTGVLVLDSQCKPNFFTGVPLDCVDATRNYVDARRVVLDELAALERFPNSRLNMSYDGTMSDVSSRVLQQASTLRSLGKFANVDATLRIIDGDTNGATRALILQLRLSEMLSGEPSLIFHLVANANDTLAAQSAEGLLRTHELTVEDLTRLQQEWDRHAGERTIKWAILGERASFVRLTDEEQLMADAADIRARFELPPQEGWQIPNPVDWIPFKDDWFLYESRVQGVTILSRLAAASGECPELLAAVKHEQESLPEYAPGRDLIGFMLPSLARGVELHARSLAFLRCVPVALAAERFRLETGRFPETAHELVPDYVGEVPDDPFDGQLLRLVPVKDGLVVYSVGENQTDDGGSVAPKPRKRVGQDFGFRLLHPNLRKLVTLEETSANGE